MRLLPIPMHLKEDRYVTLCKTWRHVIRKTCSDLKQDDKCQWLLWKVVPLKQTLLDISALNQFFIPSAVSICKRAWDVPKQREWHHAWTWSSGNKKTHTMEGKKKQQCISQDFPRKTATGSLDHSKSEALASGNLYYSSYWREGRGQFSSLHRKRVISKLWLLRAQEREWLIRSKWETHGLLRGFLSTLLSYFSYMKKTNY